MSGTPGTFSRKDGRISDLPDRVKKMYLWLTGIALLTPVIMLLIGFGAPQGVLPTWAGVLLAILPTGLVLTVLVALLRTGMGGIVGFSFILTLMQFMALSWKPYTTDMDEMILTRITPVLVIGLTLWLFWLDLHYNLRAFWYSVQAMKDLQESMMRMKMKADAKKRGETYDPDKVMDVQAVVRAMEQQTGQEVPKHMQGLTLKPGFRQEGKDSSRRDGGSQYDYRARTYFNRINPVLRIQNIGRSLHITVSQL